MNQPTKSMCKCNECIHLTRYWHAFKHKYQWSLPEFSGPPLLPRVIQILHPTCSPCLSCPFYCITLPKKWKECEVNAKCMRPLEIITHESPRSFPHTVWIPHLKRVMQRCTHTAVPNVSCEDKVKTVPAPFASRSQSLSSSTLTGSEC